MTYVLEHFELKADPFSITPNMTLYCNLPRHQEAYQTLRFGLQQGNAIMLVSGEVGTGKTILCRKLLHSISNDFSIIFIANPKMSVVALLKAIAEEMKIAYEGENDLYKLINMKLIENAQNGINTLLVIDEAQALDDNGLETIRLLTNLETGTHKLMQIILFAQPELLIRLSQVNFRQFSQRLTHVCKLNTLDLESFKSYMTTKLIKSGHPTGHMIDDKATQLIWKKSHGTPRIANVLSAKALLSAFSRGSTRITKEDVKRAVNESDQQLSSLSGTIKHKAVNSQVIITVLSFLGLFLFGALIAIILKNGFSL